MHNFIFQSRRKYAHSYTIIDRRHLGLGELITARSSGGVNFVNTGAYAYFAGQHMNIPGLAVEWRKQDRVVYRADRHGIDPGMIPSMNACLRGITDGNADRVASLANS